MNKSAFLKLIQQASNISDQQTEELEKMAVAFPYCQTAHLLLAKSAYDKGSMLSTQRLRKAASYATNRQVLKRVIHATPAEPVYETILIQEPAVTKAETPSTYTSYSEIGTSPISDNVDSDVQEETQITSLRDSEGSDITIVSEVASVNPEVTVEEETEEFTEAEVITEDEAPVPEEKHNASESELLSLLTISSLSVSFTDLLAQEPDPEPEIEEPEQSFESFSDTGSELETEENEASETWQTQHIHAAEGSVEDTLIEKKPSFEEEQKPEDATIKYASDEIDRLYAEDALGYWMGSSRMGEQLQLKDEYTRPRPQSFHPELILEYNRTHELEKAIQPPANVLSQQLDIIEQFLKLNPRLKTMANLKIKEEPQQDLSLNSSKIKKSMASENLATIFIKQGKIKKAMKIYEQLILKNPEKKTYFAEQIEKLQNQI